MHIDSSPVGIAEISFPSNSETLAPTGEWSPLLREQLNYYNLYSLICTCMVLTAQKLTFQMTMHDSHIPP